MGCAVFDICRRPRIVRVPDTLLCIHTSAGVRGVDDVVDPRGEDYHCRLSPGDAPPRYAVCTCTCTRTWAVLVAWYSRCCMEYLDSLIILLPCQIDSPVDTITGKREVEG